MLDHPESVAAEAFRSLRTSVLLSRPKAGPRVILVTSCIPGEGKSTVTVNLAISFAQHGKKVLIMEADMRRPSMKHVLDVSNDSGLSNVLAGTLTLDESTLHGVHVPTLDVLPAGPRPPMPSEMLGSSAFESLLEQLRSLYDIVLIDSPSRASAYGCCFYRVQDGCRYLGGSRWSHHQALPGSCDPINTTQWHAGHRICDEPDGQERRSLWLWIRIRL